MYCVLSKHVASIAIRKQELQMFEERRTYIGKKHRTYIYNTQIQSIHHKYVLFDHSMTILCSKICMMHHGKTEFLTTNRKIDISVITWAKNSHLHLFISCTLVCQWRPTETCLFWQGSILWKQVVSMEKQKITAKNV